MHIGFGILLPREPLNYIRKTQLELHHQLSILPGRQYPHITFKSPFKVHDIERYVAYFDSLAGQTRPFEIKLGGIGSFGKEILYLDVADSPDLDQLHQKVIREMEEKFDIKPDQVEGVHVRFHATICKPQTPDVFDEARKLLERDPREFTFQARDIGIFYHLGGEHSWIVYRQTPLQG